MASRLSAGGGSTCQAVWAERLRCGVVGSTVKSNMQALEGGGHRNAWSCFTTVLREQGMAGLYKGMAPRFVRVCLEIGLHFTLYEIVARQLDARLWW